MKGLAQEKQYSRLKRFTSLYAQMLLNGDIDWVRLGNVYNTKEQLPEVKAKRLLRSETVQTMVTDKLIELTEKHGISAKVALEHRKLALDMATDKGDLTNMNKALDSFDSKLDLVPQKTVNKTIEAYEFTKHLPDGSKQQLKAKQTKEIDSLSSIDTGNNDE